MVNPGEFQGRNTQRNFDSGEEKVGRDLDLIHRQLLGVTGNEPNMRFGRYDGSDSGVGFGMSSRYTPHGAESMDKALRSSVRFQDMLGIQKMQIGFQDLVRPVNFDKKRSRLEPKYESSQSRSPSNEKVNIVQR